MLAIRDQMVRVTILTVIGFALVAFMWSGYAPERKISVVLRDRAPGNLFQPGFFRFAVTNRSCSTMEVFVDLKPMLAR